MTDRWESGVVYGGEALPRPVSAGDPVAAGRRNASPLQDAAAHPRVRPDLVVLLGAGLAVALVSVLSLPWPAAIASTLLGALMIAGAEADARTYLLPDSVTWGGLVSGIIAAAALGPLDPWSSAGAAMMRAAGTAGALALLRISYARLRGREGLGFGDVKLAAAVGAWLPLASIPVCFALATCAALVTVLVAFVRGQRVDATAKLPLGAFLCPTLWLVFYADQLGIL
jgi:leader peptidase (prepilin peptidase) / N-methyltransferase